MAAQQSAPFPKQATFEENFSLKMSFGVGAASSEGRTGSIGTKNRAARVFKIFDERSNRTIGVVVSSYGELLEAIKRRFPDFDEKRYPIQQRDKQNIEVDNDAYFQTLPSDTFLRIIRVAEFPMLSEADSNRVQIILKIVDEDKMYAVGNNKLSWTIDELKARFLESKQVK